MLILLLQCWMMKHAPARRDVALLCPAVTIAASGAAAAAQPSRLGTFRATGEFSSGRQVFRNTRGQHLLVPAGKNVWSVQSSATATVGVVLLMSDYIFCCCVA